VTARAAGKAPRGDRLLSLLVLPALVFVLFVFVAPVSWFLTLAVDNSELGQGLSRTAAALEDAPPIADEAPDEAVFAALVADLAAARRSEDDALIAQALNQRLVGTRFLVIKTARDAARGDFAPPYRASVLAAHEDWADPAIWRTIAQHGGRLTDYNLLVSLDLRRNAAGEIVQAPPEQSLFRQILLRTMWISLVVTAICAALALPLAQAIVSAPPTWGRVLFALVLFPLWSSLLVRTVIWIIVLQRNGPVNAALAFLGITDGPVSLIYTRFSLYLAMVQVLLPLMVLSVVSVMRRVPDSYMKAALSLGAPWFTAWRTVQLPLIMPGVLAGGAIVFVFSIGYYITPVLVGGPGDQMISSMIAFYTNRTLNWGLAAALSIQVLALLAAFALMGLGLRALAARRPA
jgi:putative spermidine/putrescine transport system permease protein